MSDGLPGEITPLILTGNEEPNLRRTLDKLAWAREIVVVDSFSTDRTLEIARSIPRVRVVQRAFDSFAGQCNFGLEQITSEWVLSLDADYVLGDGFENEIAALRPDDSISGYRAGFRYCINGRPLRSSLYPPRTVLYRRGRARYEDDGHGHRVVVQGEIRELQTRIDHDDRKSLSHWIASQDRYAIKEAAKLLAADRRDLKWQDRLRLWMVPAPIVMFFYCLLGRGLVLDGVPGWIYTWQRVLAEIMLSLRLLEHKLASR